MIRDAREVLSKVFGFEAFRGQQQDIIEEVVGGGDALVLMPTGGGKSLCYQIPALCRPGTGVVISPLIALMQDQVESLRQLGVQAAALNSSLDYHTASEVERALVAGALDLIYVAPERLLTPASSACWSAARSPSSPSTRPTASRNGATTSGRSTGSSRRCARASRRCRAWP